MDYEKKYKALVEAVKILKEANPSDEGIQNWVKDNVPELKESEDERIRKELIDFVKSRLAGFSDCKRFTDWLEKQGEKSIIIDIDKMVLKYSQTMDGDFGLPVNCQIRAYRQGINDALHLSLNLEKQGKKEPNKMPIWKHWKDGIAGNGDGKLIYLIKYGNTYSLSSCLSFECDYILLSDLDKCEQKPFDYENATIVQKDFAPKIKPKFKIGDIIEYVGERKELIDGKYEIKEIGNDFYVATNGTIIPFKFEKYYINKSKPKFKVGDWVVFNNKHQSIYQVEKIEDGYYILRHTYGGTFRVCVLHDESLRLWTIEDAKDGDVLACNKEILLFKSYSVQSRISLYYWYNGQTNNFHDKEVVDTLLTTRDKICPATKEQRNLLFQKMKDAGYEWDAEKKELKKIEQEDILEDVTIDGTEDGLIADTV